MATELYRNLIITESTKLYGHNNVDADGVPIDAGNGAVSQIVKLAKDSVADGMSVVQDPGNNLKYDVKIDGRTVSSFEVSADRFLKSVTFDETTSTLNFVFETVSGETSVSVDMSAMVEPYALTVENGLMYLMVR